MSFIPRVAVVGGGFAGLALSWYLLNDFARVEVTLFDPNGYGGEASKISAGILQKYGGLHAKLNRYAEQGNEHTLELISIASKTLNQNIIQSKGLLRVALNDIQVEAFQKCSNTYSDVDWLNVDDCKKLHPFLPDAPGIWIHSGLTIDVEAYLRGLFHACKVKGLKLIQKRVTPEEDLTDFQAVIFAIGALTASFKFFERFQIHPLKGQLIEIRWPKPIPPLPFSLLSQIYICMSKDKLKAIVGATYEHSYASMFPEPKRAIEELLPKAIALYPPLAKENCLEVKAGLRASTPSHLPLIEHVEKNIWLYAGLGSRGLLYHGFFAKELVKKIKIALEK